MKRAIISDIHANLAAFEAVLRDIEVERVDQVFCLGDIIGYGPDPRACLELARSFPVNLRGNHEEAVLFGAVGFNPKAKAAIDWTSNQLSLPSEPVEAHTTSICISLRQSWTILRIVGLSSATSTVFFMSGSLLFLRFTQPPARGCRGTHAPWPNLGSAPKSVKRRG